MRSFAVMDPDFWERLENLLLSSDLVIDRPSGSAHPRYPGMIYPLDYGYLKGAAGRDGNDIDVWKGSLTESHLSGIACTVDTLKRDGEYKLLVGCTDREMDTVREFHSNAYMSCTVVTRPR